MQPVHYATNSTRERQATHHHTMPFASPSAMAALGEVKAAWGLERWKSLDAATKTKLWNARRQRCLNRLAEEFGGMALVRSKCRLRGNVTRLLEREADGERLWKYRDKAVAAAAAASL